MYDGKCEPEFATSEIDRRQNENPYQASIEVIQDSTPGPNPKFLDSQSVTIRR
jgi:hypothetical protein